MEFHDRAPTIDEVRRAGIGTRFICTNSGGAGYSTSSSVHYKIYMIDTLGEWVKGELVHSEVVTNPTRREAILLSAIRLEKLITPLSRPERLQNVREEIEGTKEALEDLEEQEKGLVAFETDEDERDDKLFKLFGEEEAKRLISVAVLLKVEDRLDALIIEKGKVVSEEAA